MSAEGHVSGQDLCDELQVSRTAIWKYIKALKEEGYVIEAVNNKGYKLISTPDRIDETSIRSQLKTSYIGNVIEYYDEIDSTNIRAKALGESDGIDGTVVVANEQTAGRGRRGRAWKSPAGSSVAFTILLRPELKAINAPSLTIVAAMAVAAAINNIEGLEGNIKWPNDIVVNGKKVVGILTEMSTDMEYINYVVVGIGININTESFPDDIKDMATSLRVEAGREINRSKVIADTLCYFEKYYKQFIETHDLTLLSEDYNNMLINKDKEVYIMENEQKRKAIAIGIDKEGALIIKNINGDFEKVIAGEVSVRGLYGYI